jgi:hypothetical protein
MKQHHADGQQTVDTGPDPHEAQRINRWPKSDQAKTDLLQPDFHSVIDHFDLHCRRCFGSGLAHRKRGDPAIQAPYRPQSGG